MLIEACSWKVDNLFVKTIVWFTLSFNCFISKYENLKLFYLAYLPRNVLWTKYTSTTFVYMLGCDNYLFSISNFQSIIKNDQNHPVCMMYTSLRYILPNEIWVVWQQVNIYETKQSCMGFSLNDPLFRIKFRILTEWSPFWGGKSLTKWPLALVMSWKYACRLQYFFELKSIEQIVPKDRICSIIFIIHTFSVLIDQLFIIA